MIRNLQLYTICIVIIVIVLSQFTIFGKDPIQEETEVIDNISSEVNTQNDSEIINDISESKYGEPLSDVKDALNKGKQTIKQTKRNLEKIKDILDVEKSINEFTNLLD